MERRPVFDVTRQAIYLAALRKHGRKTLAAEAAGVVTNTVNRLRKADKDFAELEAETYQLYRDDCVSKIEDVALNGHLEPMHTQNGAPIMVRDKNNKLVQAFRIRYETPLRAMVLKRHEPEYRDKLEVDVSSKGGVLVVPQPMKGVADWAKLIATAKGEKQDE